MMRASTHLVNEVFIVIIMLSTVACSANPSGKLVSKTKHHNEDVHRDDDYVCPSDAFAMPPAQLNEMKNMAIRGDGKAAYKVYQYYAFCEYGGPEYSMYWLKIAVSNGCVDAKEELDALGRSEAARKRVIWRLGEKKQEVTRLASPRRSEQ